MSREEKLSYQREVLKSLRKEINMSMKEFALFLDIPLRTFEAWELKSRVMPDYLLKLIIFKIQSINKNR